MALACPVQTQLQHSWNEDANPGEQIPELRAYKLGKKRWSYNQVELVLRDAGGGRQAVVQQAVHAASAKFPEAHQESVVAFLIQLESGQKLQAHVYICYDQAPTGVPAASTRPKAAAGSTHYAWQLVTRKDCCKGCQGPVLRSIQRFGRLGKRALNSDAPSPPEPSASATKGSNASMKDPKFMYLSLDEACTHVDATAFRLVAGIYNRQGNRLLTTAVSPPIRVLANNDVPTGAARIPLEATLPADWEGWGGAGTAQAASTRADMMSTPRAARAAPQQQPQRRRKLALDSPKPAAVFKHGTSIESHLSAITCLNSRCSNDHNQQPPVSTPSSSLPSKASRRTARRTGTAPPSPTAAMLDAGAARSSSSTGCGSADGSSMPSSPVQHDEGAYGMQGLLLLDPQCRPGTLQATSLAMPFVLPLPSLPPFMHPQLDWQLSGTVPAASSLSAHHNMPPLGALPSRPALQPAATADEEAERQLQLLHDFQRQLRAVAEGWEGSGCSAVHAVACEPSKQTSVEEPDVGDCFTGGSCSPSMMSPMMDDNLGLPLLEPSCDIEHLEQLQLILPPPPPVVVGLDMLGGDCLF